jgi:hypothetical protein
VKQCSPACLSGSVQPKVPHLGLRLSSIAVGSLPSGPSGAGSQSVVIAERRRPLTTLTEPARQAVVGSISFLALAAKPRPRYMRCTVNHTFTVKHAVISFARWGFSIQRIRCVVVALSHNVAGFTLDEPPELPPRGAASQSMGCCGDKSSARSEK